MCACLPSCCNQYTHIKVYVANRDFLHHKSSSVASFSFFFFYRGVHTNNIFFINVMSSACKTGLVFFFSDQRTIHAVRKHLVKKPASKLVPHYKLYLTPFNITIHILLHNSSLMD